MNNSINFASRITAAMSDYQIHLDDDVVRKAEMFLGKEDLFPLWLQKKVEQWLPKWINQDSVRSLSYERGLSDESLAEILKDFPPLTMEDFPHLKESDYKSFLRLQGSRLPEGMKKWL